MLLWHACTTQQAERGVRQECAAKSRGTPSKAAHAVQVRKLLKRDGLRGGLYAGYGAFLLRDLPFDAIEFWAFDTLNLRLAKFLKRDLNAAEHAVCGAIAGAVTGTPSAAPCMCILQQACVVCIVAVCTNLTLLGECLQGLQPHLWTS